MKLRFDGHSREPQYSYNIAFGTDITAQGSSSAFSKKKCLKHRDMKSHRDKVHHLDGL